MDPNFYKVLGISPTASAKEVKAAYKQLALKYHPDKNPGNVRAEELFKLVNTAYQTLSDPEKRTRYDLRLQYQLEQRRMVQAHQAAGYEARYYQTRPPAGVSERYYRNIKRENKHFSRKDWLITVAFVAGLLLFSFLLKTAMDHITGEDRYKTALSYIEDGKYSSAHRLLTDAIHFMPDNAAAYQARASIELDVYENYRSALNDLNKAISLQEQPSAQAYYLRGRSYQQLAQFEQAERDLTHALRLNRKLWVAHLARGEVRLFYLKKYEPAIADFTTFLNHSSTSREWADALTFRGFGFYKLKAYAQAEQDYKMALDADRNNGRIYYLLGRAELERQVAPDSACTRFLRAYELGYSAAVLELRTHCQPAANQ